MADEKLNMSPEEKDAGEKGPAKKDKAAKEKTPELDKPKGRGGRKAKEENAGPGEQSGTAPKGKPWSGGWSPEPPREQRGAEQRRAYLRDACRPGERCTPSVCFSCHSTCEVLVYTDAASGKVLRVEGDPNSPQTHGRLCAKGLGQRGPLPKPKKAYRSPAPRRGAGGGPV